MYHFIDNFLCWNITTPRACITKPVYNKMMFFALVVINALYYWAACEGKCPIKK